MATATIKAEKISQERTELQKRLSDENKYRVSYLGGGDFIVHVMGIDPTMDQAVHAVEKKEACDGCD